MVWSFLRLQPLWYWNKWIAFHFYHQAKCWCNGIAALIHQNKSRDASSRDALNLWKLTVTRASLQILSLTSVVKDGAAWVLGVEGNRRVNLKAEQTGLWLYLFGWHCALADGSLKTICVERAGDARQVFQHLRTQPFKGVLSVRDGAGNYKLLLCRFLKLLCTFDQLWDVGGKFKTIFCKMKYQSKSQY